MSTKINGIDPSAIASVGAGRAVQRPQDAASGGAQGSSESSSGNDSSNVQITGTALQMAGLEQAVRDMPAVNESRVAQIRTAIEQGTYTVRPQHIADQLMSLERSLGQLPDAADSESPGESSGNAG